MRHPTEPSDASPRIASYQELVDHRREACLVRVLGPWMAIALVIGNTIGSGIFAKPGGIARDAGSFGVILSAWVFGGLLCILGALCFAELGAMLPQSGGLYVYLREAYGKLVAFLFGWCEFLFARPASIGALAVIFAGSMASAAELSVSHTRNAVVACVLVGLVAWVNVLGALWGGRLNTFVTAIKVGSLVVLSALPFALSAAGRTGVDWENFATTIEPAKQTLPEQFGAVLLAVLFAYNGWHQLTSVAEEVRDPERWLPRAIFIGLGAVIVLYVAANVAYFGAMSMREIEIAGEHTAEIMVRRLVGPWGGAAMSAVVMCSTFGAITSNMLHGPRVSYAMGRDRLFFQALGHTHASYHTPAISIAVQGAMSIAMVAASAILVETVDYFSERSIFDLLTNYVIFSSSIFYMLAVAAVLILRRTRRDLPRPYHTWGYPVTPWLFIVSYLWFLYEVLMAQPFEGTVGLVLIAVGVPFFWIWRRLGYDRA